MYVLVDDRLPYMQGKPLGAHCPFVEVIFRGVLRVHIVFEVTRKCKDSFLSFQPPKSVFRSQEAQQANVWGS